VLHDLLVLDCVSDADIRGLEFETRGCRCSPYVYVAREGQRPHGWVQVDGVPDPSALEPQNGNIAAGCIRAWRPAPKPQNPFSNT